MYSTVYSTMYNVVYSTLGSINFSSVYKSTSYNLHESWNGLFLRKKVSTASHFDVWFQFIVQYSVQCTVQCTLYCSVQYRCVGYPGTQWYVTITKVIRIKSFPVTFMQNNFSLFCGKREKISNYSKRGWTSKILLR